MNHDLVDTKLADRLFDRVSRRSGMSIRFEPDSDDLREADAIMLRHWVEYWGRVDPSRQVAIAYNGTSPRAVRVRRLEAVVSALRQCGLARGQVRHVADQIDTATAESERDTVFLQATGSDLANAQLHSSSALVCAADMPKEERGGHQ